MVSRRPFSCLMTLVAVVAFGHPAEADLLYWTADDGIYRSNTDGSGVTPVVTGLSGRAPGGIAIDAANGHVFWTEFSTSDIWRTNLDGSGTVRLVDQNLFSFSGLALDLDNRRMYWGEANAVARDDLDPGTAPARQTVVGTAPWDVALDVANSHVYWTHRSNGTVRRVNFDGTGQVAIVSGLESPFGIDLDLVNGHVYWTEPGADRIARANLDGTDITSLVSGADLNAAKGITIDAANDRMYWTNGENIFASTLSGSGRQAIVSQGQGTYFLTLGPSPAAVPEPSSMLLLTGLGFGMFAVQRFRRKVMER